MWIVKGTVRVAVTLAIVSAVTAILWHFKLTAFGPEHPVFVYLLPLALVMIVYGSWPALLGIFTATACADYFLYDPLYSFDIGSPVEMGDLTCFAILAVIAVKCAAEVFRPSANIAATKSRYGRT
jgi:K+-sensing histidine kinase KdpD